MKFKNYSNENLFKIYASLMKELRLRGILRTGNNPVADYAEFLASKKMKLQLTPNSNKSYDAIDKSLKIKYQIKSRRIVEGRSPRQLSVIRSLNFDFLLVFIFDEFFNILEVYKIPCHIIKQYSRFSKHQNGYILILRGAILRDKKTEDITKPFLK